MPADLRIVEKLYTINERQLAEGATLTQEQLTGYYQTFRDAFGPQVLAGMDGQQLLETMHQHGNKDSLVYWLEFKNDEDLPAARLGSIFGGSALKFGIFQRKETGQWMTGSPVKQRVLALDEAIAVARRNRDQFVAGAAVLARYEAAPALVDFERLQEEMEEAAPDVNDTSWGHKYFHLLYPELVDVYHSPVHQRFHLVKLLQVPPEHSGRYVCARYYFDLARELGIPVVQLANAINEMDGGLHRYWRVGTSFGDTRRTEWPKMFDEAFVGIGWNEVGSLAEIPDGQEGRGRILELVEHRFDCSASQAGKAANQLHRFLHKVQEGDYFFAADGASILGIGKVSGDYFHRDGDSFAHCRPVSWLNTEEWKLPVHEGLRAPLYEMKKYENLVEAERRVVGGKLPHPPPAGPHRVSALAPVDPVVAQIKGALDRKRQVILYGPPGTGKTFWAEKAARELAARSWLGRSNKELSDAERAELPVELCTFHPAYGYEDFLEGYRPEVRKDVLVYILKDGIFKRLCERAKERPDKEFYLIVDEINRGDIPRIFGELLTVLEKDKRGKVIRLPLSGELFSVPSNVLVIGTMNTADRSIALLDTALRRRFAFVELMPDSELLRGAVPGGIPLGPWLDALNERVRQHLGRDARNLQMGHSYLMQGGGPVSDFSRFARVVQHDVVPLLEEYCYEDYSTLELLLGRALIDRGAQRVREELFEPGNRERLITALLETCQDIVTTGRAVSDSGAEEEEADEVESDQDEGNAEV
jgi:5-methylcytosine-specific restriction protein B